MRTFTTHSMRNMFAMLVVVALFGVAYFSSSGLFKSSPVQAVGENVSGYAWSDTIGWIEFSGSWANGVNISPTTGTGIISGSAWSRGATENGGVGWISFDRTKTGNPPSAPFNGGSGPIAQVDWATGAVTGWARALSACQNNLVDVSGNCTASGAGDASGGWDGWIKLSGTWTNGVSIDRTTGRFSGYAWGGGEVIGWISFDCASEGSCNPVSYYVQGPAGVGVCDSSNPTIIWSTCDATTSCVSGGAAIQTDLTGGQYGTCADGSTGSPVRGCTAPSTTCVAGTGTWFTGDTICSPGEPLTSPDCAPRPRFWQF